MLFITFREAPCNIESDSGKSVLIDFGTFTTEFPKKLIPEYLMYPQANLIYFNRLYENGDLVKGFTHPYIDLDKLAEIYLS